MKLNELYSEQYFASLLAEDIEDQDAFLEIAEHLLGNNALRINAWAYAGKILWCRDYYGRYYKLLDLVNSVIKRCIPLLEDSEKIPIALSRLYISLIMVHPFYNANGRVCYAFTAFCAYKYHGIYPQLTLLKNTDRLHESFRYYEHQTYNQIMRLCEEKREQGLFHFDNRLKNPTNDIGYYNYGSVMKLLLGNEINSCLFPLFDYFQNALFNNSTERILYRE